jgi:hypothetical protein
MGRYEKRRVRIMVSFSILLNQIESYEVSASMAEWFDGFYYYGSL